MFSYRCKCFIFKKKFFPNDEAFISSQSPCLSTKMCGFLSYSEILTKERFFLRDVDFFLNEVDVFSEQCFFMDLSWLLERR